jgi:hypothetical protein
MPPSNRQALLLVDGYNIIGAWSHLKSTCERHGLESARRELVEVLINYTSLAGHDTQVVFDAHYQHTPGYSENFTSSLSVYYTAFAQTADTYIEKLCAGFYHQNQSKYERLIVATSDEAHRLTILGYGAEWISAKKLRLEVDSSMNRLTSKKRYQKISQGRFLLNSLDPKAQALLKEWRKGIR